MPLEVKSVQGQYLQAFADGLARVYPRRVITRNLLDFAKRDLKDLKRGLYTVVADGQPKPDWPMEYFEFLLVGEVHVGEKAPPSDVEEIELRMIDELRAYVEGVRGLGIARGATEQSAQLDAPYGWVRMACTAGPFDASQWLTPDAIDEQGVNPFQRFFADVDIPPFLTDAARAGWMNDAGDEPDYSKGEPDLQMQANMPGSAT